jgi:hypothetical protein
MLKLRGLLVVAAVATATGSASAPGPAPVPQLDDAPHLLNCTVKDTISADDNGSLVMEKPLPPGTRAIGRLTSFVLDPVTGVVRIAGLGNIAWIMPKGRGLNEPQMIFTPGNGLESATSISIHVRRVGDDVRFVFFEVDRIMSGTCELLK